MKKVSVFVASMVVSLFFTGMVYADDDFRRYQKPGSLCPDGKIVEYSVAINKVQQILNKNHPQYYIEDVDIEYTVYKIEAEKKGWGKELVFIVDICTGKVSGPYPDY